MIKNIGLLLCTSLIICIAGYAHAFGPELPTQSSTQEPQAFFYTFKVKENASPEDLQRILDQSKVTPPPFSLVISRTKTCDARDQSCMRQLEILVAARKIIDEIEATQAKEDTEQCSN